MVLARTSKMTNAETLAKIQDAIGAGLTIYASTRLRVTKFTPSTVAKIRANGAEPFKIGKDGTLRMLEGWTKGKPRFVCISLSTGTLLVGLKAQ